MCTRPLNPLTRAIGWALTRLADCLQHECGPDSIVVTLAEADIFVVAITLADERASNDALIAYATGDKMPLTPAVLNGLLHIPGISPAILLESHGGQLVCTRASVDELLRSQARIEKDVSSAAELRDSCGVLQALLPLPGPTRIHRWKNYSGQPYAGKPRTITGGVVGEIRPNRILSTKASAICEQFTNRFIASLLADKVDTADSAGPDESQIPTAKSRCLLAGAASCPALFAINSTNGGESAMPQQYAVPVVATSIAQIHAPIAKRVLVKVPHFGALPVRQRKKPVYSRVRSSSVSASLLSERNHCTTPALAPAALTARYHVPP